MRNEPMGGLTQSLWNETLGPPLARACRAFSWNNIKRQSRMCFPSLAHACGVW